MEERKALNQIFCQISRWLRGNLGKRSERTDGGGRDERLCIAAFAYSRAAVRLGCSVSR